MNPNNLLNISETTPEVYYTDRYGNDRMYSKNPIGNRVDLQSISGSAVSEICLTISLAPSKNIAARL